ncbi:MAG: hypothetical protein ACPG5B_03180 [Chitinophagales bacterium]
MKKISRKKFLQISSLGIASLAFPTPFLGSKLDKKKHHIIILGTSLEALIFAQKLKENGFDDFLLLDVKENETILDNDFPILVSADENKTLEWLEKEKITYFQVNKKGKTIGKYELEKSEKEELEQAVFELKKKARKLDWQYLQNDKKAEIYDHMFLAEWLENHLQTLTAHAFFAYKINEIFGCQTDEISLLYFLYFLNKKNNFDILNFDNQCFIVDEKILSIVEKMKASFAHKTFFTKKIKAIQQTEKSFFIDIENEKIVASNVVVAADFLKNKSIYLPTFSNIFSEPKMLEKTKVCIKLTYTNAFWQKKSLNGQIVSFSGLIKKTLDTSLSHEKYASLLVFPDTDYFSSLEKSERKELIIDELIDFFGDEALSYIQYEEYIKQKQVRDISVSFLSKNNISKAVSKHLFWLKTPPTINNGLSKNIQAADSVIEVLLKQKMV